MNVSALEVCRRDLYTSRNDLEAKYPKATVEKVIRVREMHQWLVANPTTKDREFIEEDVMRFAISEQNAYSDLRIVKQLLPTLVESSRNYARWKYSEMIQETYKMAKDEGDLKTMERCATSYARHNNISLEDPDDPGSDAPDVQPFVATMDPRVLGIPPIPNLEARIDELLKKYTRESSDIEDVDFEEADLEEERLFADTNALNDGL
ncbi:MAG: hypothetical protein K2H86_06075 [Muribaculaceae bacterium]|nr:hypothetical protein [Muribaculaceae bacterium]